MALRVLSLSVVLAAAFAASTGYISSLSVASQTYISPDGIEFIITTSNSERNPPTHEAWNAVSDPLHTGVVERDTTECTDPDICVCGSTCNSVSCHSSPAGTVQSSDCARLANAIHATLSGTFFLSPGRSKTANSGSCMYVFTNEGHTELEYCWDDFANIGRSASEHCPRRQALCQFRGSAVRAIFSPY